MTKAETTLAPGGSEDIHCISYLRGLAAFGVALFHVRIELWVGFDALKADPTLGGFWDHALSWLSLPTVFMGSGVMLFFVISGFCIHHPYAGPKGKKLDLREYAIRRLFRIYPPYLAAILFAFFVQWYGFHHGYLKGLDGKNYQLATMFMQNAFGHQPECNGALWTIPIEVAFYICFPLVYLGLRRNLFGTLVAGLIVSLLAISYSLHGPINYNFLPYWFVWIAGAAIAERYKTGTLKQPPLWVFIVAILFFAVGICCTWHARSAGVGPFTGPITQLECFGYGIGFIALVWWSVVNQWFYQMLPAAAHYSLLFLGAISYSLYLFHMPLFRFCGWIWLSYFGQKPVSYLISYLFTALAILVAWIIYKFIEAPAHNAGRKVAKWVKFRPTLRPQDNPA